MSGKEDVIHNNLKIIEQRLRNVYNCGYRAAENEQKAMEKKSYQQVELMVKSISAAEMDAVRDEYYHLGYKAGYEAAKTEFEQLYKMKRGRQ